MRTLSSAWAGFGLSTLLLCTGAPSEAATLLGDQISFLRAYPTVNVQYLNSINPTTVMTGPADAVRWGNGIVLDPEASSMKITYEVSTGMLGSASVFDGFVVSGIDAQVDAVSLLSNTSSYAVRELIATTHGFRISLGGNSGPGTIEIGLQLSDPGGSSTPVPTPGSLALATLALGLAVRRTRLR